jgi:RNA recognition motif-containing protein
MARTKVFVGNLAFKTNEGGLREQFETVGKVISATIVARGRRSLGYGFVEFENEAAAAKAVQALNKKEIDGRQVNVEIAKPRDENAPRPPQQFQGGYQGGFRPRGGFRSRGGFPQRGRGFGPRGGNFYSSYNTWGGRGRGFGPRGGNFSRPPRPTAEQRNYQPSPTTLYVTNLPFTLANEDFTKIFTDAGVKPKSVKIIVKPNGKSKGYGFAEFENTADQQKGLTVDKKSIEGREIVVKVALVPPTPPATPQQPGQTGTPATPQQQTAPPAKPATPQQQTTPAQTTAQPPKVQTQTATQPPQQQQQPAKAPVQATPAPQKQPENKATASPKDQKK